jgi:hypothetical protein
MEMTLPEVGGRVTATTTADPCGMTTRTATAKATAESTHGARKATTAAKARVKVALVIGNAHRVV